MTVFISYAREDFKQAKKVFDDLNKISTIKPWLDKNDLLPGMIWEDEIMKVLEECRYIILLLSKNSVSKVGFIQKEVKEALSRLDEFPSGKIFIIPVRLDDCKINDRKLKRLHWVDLFEDWERGMEKIKSSILLERNTANFHTERFLDDFEAVFEDGFTDRKFSQPKLAEELPPIRMDYLGVDFMDMDLTGWDFSGKNLQGASFVNCKLANAQFKDANLKGVNFERAFLEKADFENANLWGVNLWHADLKEVKNLDKVKDLNYANFYMVQNLPAIYKPFIVLSVTTDLPDYNSFLMFFKNQLNMSLEELKYVFTWLNHNHFVRILSARWR